MKVAGVLELRVYVCARTCEWFDAVHVLRNRVNFHRADKLHTFEERADVRCKCVYPLARRRISASCNSGSYFYHMSAGCLFRALPETKSFSDLKQFTICVASCAAVRYANTASELDFTNQR